MAKITVIGSFVMDNVATMKKFPAEGETVMGLNLGIYPGGKGCNQCISIAKLGGDVEMCGMVGKDENGSKFLEILRDNNVACENVFTCDLPTAVAQIQINSEGQNRICVIPSANYAFSDGEIEKVKDVIRNTELLVLQMELRYDITLKLIDLAHDFGTKILLNPAPAVKLDEEVFSKIDYLTPNETELSILTDMPTDTVENVEKAADKLLSLGVKTLIVTLGSLGAMYANKDGKKLVKGFKVKAVDTVAAGDSFNGALAVKLIEGESLENAVYFANAMGALTVQKQGAIPSLHTKKEVEDFIKNYNLSA